MIGAITPAGTLRPYCIPIAAGSGQPKSLLVSQDDADVRKMTLLVRHPPPFPTESLMGYILRLSQINGYLTPWTLFLLAGIGQSEVRTSGMRVTKLAKVCARSVRELETIAYRDDRGSRFCRLLGHRLPPGYLRLTRPAMCPDCVAEKGFIEAHWDLIFMIGCPVHKRALLWECPACNRPLRWFRRGLLECSCGENLSNASRLPLSSYEIDLLDVIQRKVFRIPAKADCLSRLPCVGLAQLNLRSMLFLVSVLGRHALRQSRKTDTNGLQRIVPAAAGILADWPQNFFDLLESIADSGITARTGYARSCLRSIYGSLVKSGVANKDQFIRKALLDFAERHWGSGGYFKTITSQPVEPRELARFIPTSQFAKRLGIHPKTAARLLNDGIIPSRTVRVGNINRAIVDSQRIDIAPIAPGTILGRRTAAAMIGIPVRLLERLKKDSLYKSNHLPSAMRGFHQNDIRNFTSSLKKLAVPASVVRPSPSSVLTLANALHRVRFSLELQTRLIGAILSRRLSISGGSRKLAMELSIGKQEFDRFIDAETNRLCGATETYQGAATLLRCANPSIDGLIRQGLLATVKIGSSRRISRESIAAFKRQYVPLSVIAMDFGTSARALMRWCEQHGVFTLTVSHRSRRQAFVRREDLQHIHDGRNTYTPSRHLHREKTGRPHQ